MKYTKAQQMMIDDGLPPSLIVSQEERASYWLENPPRKTDMVRVHVDMGMMTEAEIRLLLELKDSKERGAASLGCLNHRIEPIAQLEKRGFAQQHGFGPTSFYITDAGMAEAKKHKQRPDTYTAGILVKFASTEKNTGPMTINGKVMHKVTSKGKAPEIVAMMRRPGGVTREEVLKAIGWSAVSMQQQAAAVGVELVIDKSRKPYRYMVKE